MEMRADDKGVEDVTSAEYKAMMIREKEKKLYRKNMAGIILQETLEDEEARDEGP